jgi:hypothetical protein
MRERRCRPGPDLEKKSAPHAYRSMRKDFACDAATWIRPLRPPPVVPRNPRSHAGGPGRVRKCPDYSYWRACPWSFEG